MKRKSRSVLVNQVQIWNLNTKDIPLFDKGLYIDWDSPMASRMFNQMANHPDNDYYPEFPYDITKGY